MNALLGLYCLQRPTKRLKLNDFSRPQEIDFAELALEIRKWGRELGFQQIGISDIDLTQAEKRLQSWLAKGFHGDMEYMSRHGKKRSQPAQLIPGTIRVISGRMDYLPPETQDPREILDHEQQAYVSRYALGRDYHKLIRKRLATLANRIGDRGGPFGYRVFVDSAPVLEKPVAEKAGLGWIGKHTNLINRNAGSWFFLGEIYTDLELPIDVPETSHCGTCRSCMDVCPTGAIVKPYELDARRCISYLTIELKDSIPLEFRKQIGNRIYGCDDCQLFCPWNKFAQHSEEPDFTPRHRLDNMDLVELFSWEEETWLRNTQGSAIRRIGFERWLRNIAVALGNAKTSSAVLSSLRSRIDYPSAMVREHISWALSQHNVTK
jgi:epoxyqueuosine reductase